MIEFAIGFNYDPRLWIFGLNWETDEEGNKALKLSLILLSLQFTLIRTW